MSEINSQVIKIKLKAFDHALIDKSASEIVETARRTGARVRGPYPLPTDFDLITLLSSSFKHKNARTQFEMRTHKRVVYIEDPTDKTVDALAKLDLPAGVDVQIAVNQEG